MMRSEVVNKFMSVYTVQYGDILDFTHVFKDEDPWFDMVKWLPEEPAKLINP